MHAEDDLIPLHNFADLHKVSRNAAIQKWKLGFIAGSNRGTSSQPYVMIGANGRWDF